jgi:exodeoxyribonuclease VII small subunit
VGGILRRMGVKPRDGTPNGDAKADSYEAHLEALDSVIADLEGDALSLEATIDRYKEGVAHLGSCRKILDAAEKRLAELVASADGGVEERPLEVGPDGLVDAGASPHAGPSSRGASRPRGASAAGAPPAALDPRAGCGDRPFGKGVGAADACDDLPF